MKSISWASLNQKIQNFELKRGITSFVNPWSMLLLKDEPEVVDKVDQWCMDGISLVKLHNAIFHKHVMRFSFDETSLAAVALSMAKRDRLKIAVVGTEERYIKQAVSHIEEKFGVKVHLYRNGYFISAEEREQYIKYLIHSQVDMVICGMGTPLQEKFLIDLRKAGWDGYGFTCGGFLHQIARRKDYYPKLFDQLNLRWVFRIIDEPKLIPRYFYYYPMFFIKFLFSISFK